MKDAALTRQVRVARLTGIHFTLGYLQYLYNSVSFYLFGT